MRWDKDTVTIKGETLTLTKRGRTFFSTLTFIKDAFIVSGIIVFVWAFCVVMAVLD